jgi:transcriptional regulator with XRE-family HTH domain
MAKRKQIQPRAGVERAFGDEMRKARLKKKISQMALYEATGLDRTFISDLERGIQGPSLRTVLRVARGVEVEPQALIERTVKGLKQEQLSERIGRAYNYISRVETGRVKTVPFDILAKLALALDVTIDDLLFIDGLAESADDIKVRIKTLLETADVKKLRKFYRLLLVIVEE